jgi:hypothetical protein
MKKPLLFLFLFISIISLFSCATNETITCYLPDSTPTSNSPLVPGGILNLKATINNYMEDVNYSWSGPNNFKSTLQNPIITDVTPAMSGEYKLKTTKGICESNESNVVVEINAPNIPCNPDKNTLIFDGDMLNPMKFSTYTTNYNQNFKIIAGNLKGDLTIEFASEERPTPGIYRICSNCPTSFLEKDQVCISFNYVEFCHAREGLVYLSSTNGKLTATFCDVIFTPSVFTFRTSAKLTEY